METTIFPWDMFFKRCSVGSQCSCRVHLYFSRFLVHLVWKKTFLYVSCFWMWLLVLIKGRSHGHNMKKKGWCTSLTKETTTLSFSMKVELSEIAWNNSKSLFVHHTYLHLCSCRCRLKTKKEGPGEPTGGHLQMQSSKEAAFTIKWGHKASWEWGCHLSPPGEDNTAWAAKCIPPGCTLQQNIQKGMQAHHPAYTMSASLL